jgi:hypothetical protein
MLDKTTWLDREDDLVMITVLQGNIIKSVAPAYDSGNTYKGMMVQNAMEEILSLMI